RLFQLLRNHFGARHLPEFGFPARFALTTPLPCDTLRAWQNLLWDAASAHCWAAVPQSQRPRRRPPFNPQP
ncbi:MAG TPA: hypothetical protein VF480_10450, partial [Verrucomicrobiae bacterium]